MLVFVSAVAWYATGCAIRIFQNNPSISRADACSAIIDSIHKVQDTGHTFGAAFDATKTAYSDAVKAFRQGMLMRQRAPKLKKPIKGLLPGKTVKIRKARTQVGAVCTSVNEGYGGFEVVIKEVKVAELPEEDNVRHTLSWSDSDGREYEFGPVILPEHTKSKGGDQRFIFL